MRSATVVIFLLAITAPVFGEQSTIDPPASMRFGALRSKKPTAPLFSLQAAPKERQQSVPLKPKLVCGMMIVPADPTIDPKMRITPPQDPNLEYKIRVVTPPSCKADR